MWSFDNFTLAAVVTAIILAAVVCVLAWRQCLCHRRRKRDFATSTET